MSSEFTALAFYLKLKVCIPGYTAALPSASSIRNVNIYYLPRFPHYLLHFLFFLYMICRNIAGMQISQAVHNDCSSWCCKIGLYDHGQHEKGTCNFQQMPFFLRVFLLSEKWSHKLPRGSLSSVLSPVCSSSERFLTAGASSVRARAGGMISERTTAGETAAR